MELRDLHAPGGTSAAQRLSPKRYHLEGSLASFSFGSFCGDAHLPALIKFHQRGAGEGKGGTVSDMWVGSQESSPEGQQNE